MLDFSQLVELISRGGLLVALLVAIWGGMTGRYLWRGSYDEILKARDAAEAVLKHDLEDMTKDRDFWRGQAMQALTTANKAVTIAKTSNSESTP